MKLRAMFAWNDWRNGVFAGVVDQIDLFGDCETFKINGPEVRCRIEADRFKISRAWYPHFGHREWFGNWCWDMVLIELRTAAKLMNWARGHSWSLEIAAEPLWNWWHDSKRQMTEDYLKRICRTPHV